MRPTSLMLPAAGLVVLLMVAPVSAFGPNCGSEGFQAVRMFLTNMKGGEVSGAVKDIQSALRRFSSLDFVDQSVLSRIVGSAHQAHESDSAPSGPQTCEIPVQQGTELFPLQALTLPSALTVRGRKLLQCYPGHPCATDGSTINRSYEEKHPTVKPVFTQSTGRKLLQCMAWQPCVTDGGTRMVSGPKVPLALTLCTGSCCTSFSFNARNAGLLTLFGRRACPEVFPKGSNVPSTATSFQLTDG